MIRLFNVYYPTRILILFGGEALLIAASFMTAALIQLGPDANLVLNYESGYFKIVGVCVFALIVAYILDLYDPRRWTSEGEIYFRLLVVLGVVSLFLATTGFFFPSFMLPSSCFFVGLMILTVALLTWRTTFLWLVRKPILRERVLIVGGGDRAARLAQGLRSRADLGMEIVGWSGALGGTAVELSESLLTSTRRNDIERIIVALSDRRGKLPIDDLLDLKLHGIKVEEATTLLERISGKIELDHLYPSWLIFSDGFQLNSISMFLRRVISVSISLVSLIVVLPLIPFIILAIKLDSPGPVLYRQERVGKNGTVFLCYKFRTMRPDAEADTGATWASDRDPRITRVGRFLRTSRLDEIPQLWNVLRGDMGFVGPRPERPEFVKWLSAEIPYYKLRHVIRPGLTGWAQIRYKYGSSVEDAKEKLQYDLYYIKNLSVGLDLLIVFQTLKTVLLGRGAQ